ncbi:hypothetical protein [Moraxella lacunata]
MVYTRNTEQPDNANVPISANAMNLGANVCDNLGANVCDRVIIYSHLYK